MWRQLIPFIFMNNDSTPKEDKWATVILILFIVIIFIILCFSKETKACLMI